MWVESTLEVGDEAVGLRIERLDADVHERTAATLAWVTVEATSGRGPAAWEACVRDLLRDHVAFTLPAGRPDDPGSDWWSEAVSKALVAFIRENALAPRISWHIDELCRVARRPRAES